MKTRARGTASAFCVGLAAALIAALYAVACGGSGDAATASVGAGGASTSSTSKASSAGKGGGTTSASSAGGRGGGTTSSSSSGGASSSSGGASSSSGGGGCDCGPGYVCEAIVVPPVCGKQCPGIACTADADCQDAGEGLVCDTICDCFGDPSGQGPMCTPACATDQDCGPSMMCSEKHHCQPAPCASDGDCTANFRCASDSSGMHCAAKPCTKNSDCGDYCFNGTCSAVPGSCYVVP